MSEAQGRKQRVPKAIRVPDEDWESWAVIAAQVGLTRSAFIKQATAHAAGLVAAGGLPYFVRGPEATTQNTRISFSGSKGDGKADAGDRSRRDCVAKGADDEGKKKRGPKG